MAKEREVTPVTKRKIAEMTERIVREIGPEKVILIGSHARGGASSGSDVDLVIVEKGSFGPKRSRREEMTRIWRLLGDYRFSKDILVYSRKEYEYWSDSLNHLLGRASREGKVLYERSEDHA